MTKGVSETQDFSHDDPALIGAERRMELHPGLAIAAHPALSPRPAIAVSGGADSLCLALLAKQTTDPLALIVDHGLRPISAAEAVLTADRLTRLGIPSLILTLTNLHPGPGLAARARAARYVALIAATRAAGRTDLWLGHHLRDQAETLLMRSTSHSGPAGLAAMPAIRETNHVRIIRPLLTTPPGELRAILLRAGLSWIEDPTNTDPATLRARLRATLNDPGGNAASTQALAATAQQNGQTRATNDRALATELAARASIFPQGYAHLSLSPLHPAALGALIRALTGANHPPRGPSLARLAADPRAATLGGIRLVPAGRHGPGLLLVREPAAIAPNTRATPGTVWDNRFLIEAYDPPCGTQTATIGAVAADAPSLRHRSHLPDAVLRTLPALRVNGVLVEVPHIGYRARDNPAQLAVSFAPANPICGAPFGGGACGGCQSETPTPSA